ncbi:MAG: Mrp/NBP35 family ATP-binding protein [Planctomycetes bacterium]|nr:Mrp/NBP35 family ATP-binding protein [Planctomycetota bacterium]
MAVAKPADILSALGAVEDPELGSDLVALGYVQDVASKAGSVGLTLHLAMPEGAARAALVEAARAAVAGLPGVDSVDIQVLADPGERPAVDEGVLSGVRNVVAVASGKGGVGKSTVAANLALALKQTGAAVGLLDADMYGPSVPTMFRVSEPLRVADDNKILPVEALGIPLMSIGFMAGQGLPVIWRGPMVSNMLQQLLQQVAWPPLDYLVVDLPPGTGDTQLTLCQMAPVNGAVIVTTPQELSLIDAHRGLEMFRKLNVPVLGLVENMSGFTCGHCGKVTDIFRRGGGKRIATQLGVPWLGSVPLDPAVVVAGDEGEPIVVRDPASSGARAFLAVARTVAARLHEHNRRQADAPEGELKLNW